ncbi:MAG: HmuY family protein [Bacteroidota bacterium]
MKAFLPIALLISVSSFLSAQFYQVDLSPGYAKTIFYDLSTRSGESIDGTSWDIAFNVGARSSGVLVNEGIASSRSETLREVELYVSSSTDFMTADTADILERVYNSEVSWDEGAFNAPAKPEDPFDLGWGSYSPATQTVGGSRVFFLITRDGEYHKLLIQSLISGTYSFVHGPLDGSTVDTVTVAKEDFPGKSLAFFSFADGVLDLEPANWDLMFTRYTTPLPNGPSVVLDYTVTGVLHATGISVAKLSGVDPDDVPAPAAAEAYSDTLTAIGYDWKTFDRNTNEWLMPTDLVYFVQTADSLYRLQFTNFEGSSTGVTTFKLGAESTTATANLPAGINQSRVFPNPAPELLTLEVTAKFAATNLTLEVIDATGRTLSTNAVRSLNTGINQIEVPVQQLPAGNYFLRLSGSTGVLTQHFIKQ